MATFTNTQYGIKATGTAANVPNNPISKLQYYLKTVLGLIEADEDDNLESIKNYSSNQISSSEFQVIIKLCAVLQPDVFLNKCIFIAPELCGNFNNEFYQISQVTNILGIGSGVIIGGSRKKINKIMACKKEWLINNYYAPLKEIANAAEQAQKRKKTEQLALFLLANSGSSSNSSSSRNNPEDCAIM